MANMTIRECIDAVFQLLNQYSITGTVVPLSYNDQADNQNRMISLINDAQMQIATTVKPIDEHMTFIVPEIPATVPPADVVYQMPDDFNYAIGVHLSPFHGHGMIDAPRYKWVGEGTLLVPNRPAGAYRVDYCRFPVHYPATVDLNTELDNKPDTHGAIPYFVASMIMIDENPSAYAALKNQWEDRLSRLGYKPPHASTTQVQDVYGFDHFWGVWS